MPNQTLLEAIINQRSSLTKRLLAVHQEIDAIFSGSFLSLKTDEYISAPAINPKAKRWADALDKPATLPPKRRQNITPARRAKVIRLINKGTLTPGQIIKKMDISPGTYYVIQRKARQEAPKKRRGNKGLATPVRRTVEKFLRKGKLTEAAIAQLAAVSRSTVTRIKSELIKHDQKTAGSETQ